MTLTSNKKIIDSILEHNSNLLKHQCCRVSENANNEIYQKRSENKEKKLKISPDKNENRDSNRNNTNVTARKQNDKRIQNEDQDRVRDNKTPNKDIVIIGDSMIKYLNGWGKFHDSVQLKLEAIRLQQPKTLLIT